MLTLIMLLSACGSASTDSPSSDMIVIAISPSAAPISPAVDLCSSQILAGEAQVRIDQVFPSQFMASSYDLVIQIRQANSNYAFSAQIGSESFFLITHLSRSLSTIEITDVEMIFSGKMTNWIDLDSGHGLIDLWIPSQSDESRRFLEQHFLNGQSISSNAKFTISPEHMREKISADENALGILPGAWINSTVNKFLLGEAIPILASTFNEPQGALREIVACLQNGDGQELIREIYQP